MDVETDLLLIRSVPFDDLQQGAVFRYPKGMESYMKMTRCSSGENAVQLKNGITYRVPYDKQVVPATKATCKVDY